MKLSFKGSNNRDAFPYLLVSKVKRKNIPFDVIKIEVNLRRSLRVTFTSCAPSFQK